MDIWNISRAIAKVRGHHLVKYDCAEETWSDFGAAFVKQWAPPIKFQMMVDKGVGLHRVFAVNGATPKHVIRDGEICCRTMVVEKEVATPSTGSTQTARSERNTEARLGSGEREGSGDHRRQAGQADGEVDMGDATSHGVPLCTSMRGGTPMQASEPCLMSSLRAYIRGGVLGRVGAVAVFTSVSDMVLPGETAGSA